jgi:hypothetical protein
MAKTRLEGENDMPFDAEKVSKTSRVAPGEGKVKAAETPTVKEGAAARSTVVGSRMVALVGAAFVCGLVVGSVGTYLIQSHQGVNASAAPAAPGEGEQTAATITATPVTGSEGPNKLGTTTITWDTGDGSVGQVYVAPPGQPEKLFADNRSKGTLDARWIGRGEYEFRLYAGKGHDRILARVKVKGQGQ